MEYKFAEERSNDADLASGHVFYSLPGHPAFPVRLASEIFQRCMAFRGKGDSPCTIYDPCCGAAYHLSVIAYLHWNMIYQVVCSDIDEKAIQLAERNLSLLSPEGMERRSLELSAMHRLYKKETYRGALESLQRLQKQVACLSSIRTMQAKVFRANATIAAEMAEKLQGMDIDLVFTDVPDGQPSRWLGTRKSDPVESMLEALRESLQPDSLVALASGKGQAIAHKNYQRLEKLEVGKRQILILKPV